MENYDFSGWATKNDLKCSDGRIIRKDAFKHCDGLKVPLVWNHDHTDPYRIVGHALLENREEGVYTYGKFNDTDLGQTAKTYVKHGDITQLSIYANQLQQQGPNVLHGAIREVSLVLAGANPGAFIENVMIHGEEAVPDEALIYTGEDITLVHAEVEEEPVVETESAEVESDEDVIDEEVVDESEVVGEETDLSHADKEDEKGNAADGADEDEESKKKTVKEVYEAMSEEEKVAVYMILEMALKKNKDADEKEEIKHSEGGTETMKTNVFDNKNNEQENTLMHADIINDAIADGKRFGSLKESVMAHAAENNITDIQELFPKEHDLNMPPEWYKEKDDGWVAKVMRGVHHVPFSRVRALFAKMDEATARAHGYIKGNEKQVGLKLSILKRTTKPTTVYIKMAMDRDDLVDIQYDALPWIRSEGRKVLDAELARAYLLGDGRDPGEDDKIDELCIRPILTDDEMYTITYTVTDGKDFHNDFNSASENDSEAKGVIRGSIKARKGYKGSGNVTFFTTEDLITELLLIEDQNGRRIYESEAALCTALRCKEIVTVPELEQEKYADVYGIFVNMADYQVGADKGGQVTTFEDFDIDFNKEKILMETRCSGALVKPKSAIVLKKSAAVAG